MSCNGNGSLFLAASIASTKLLFSKVPWNDMTADSAQLEARTVASDDLDLVHASKNGDVAAFEELVKRYDRKLLRIAQHVTHNREDSEDAVQEAFLKAFQHLGEFREDSKFSTWLIRITLNQSLMKLRKQRRIKEVPLDEDFQADGEMLPMEVADWAPNPEQLYRTSELRDILIKALRELRPVLRTVFVLRDIEGLSMAADSRSAELESRCGEGAAMARSAAASRTLEHVLQKGNGIRAAGVGPWTRQARRTAAYFVAAVSSSVFANCI